jgi:hypothetical protein
VDCLTRPWCLDHMIRWLLSEGPAGSVVEVGVYEGGSLAYLAERVRDRPLYGYDTFRGLPRPDPVDTFHGEGQFAASENVVRRNLEKYLSVVLIGGEYPASDVRPPTPVALAHIDVDLYRPTLAALWHVWRLLAPGGRVYAGDAYWYSCSGATQAWMEFCAESGAVPVIVQCPDVSPSLCESDDNRPPLAYAEKPR